MFFLKRKLIKSFFFTLLFLGSVTANRADATIYVNAGVGSQGISFGASYYWKNLIGLRGVYDYMPNSVLKPITNMVDNASDLIIGSSAKFSSWGFDASVRPFKGAFHIDIGFRMMDYSMSVNSFKQFDVGNAIPVNIDVSGKFKFTIAKGIKPYFGLGWDFNPVVGLTLGFDVGVIYTGKWKASISDIKTTYNIGETGMVNYRNIHRVVRSDLEDLVRDLNIDLDHLPFDVDDIRERYGNAVFTTDDYGNEIGLNAYIEQNGEENIMETLINRYSDDIANGIQDVYNIRDDINDKIPSFASFWPVIKFNIGYKFDII